MILGSNLSAQKIAGASGYRSQTNGKPGRFHKSLEDEIRNYPDLDCHIKYCNTDRLRWTWTTRRRRWHLPTGGPVRGLGRATQTVENPWLMVKTGRDMIFIHYRPQRIDRKMLNDFDRCPECGKYNISHVVESYDRAV